MTTKRKQADDPPPLPLDQAAVEQVRKWILAGGSAADVGEAISTNFPQADPTALFFAAADSFRDAANFEPAVVCGWCFEAARDLYRRMLESGDYAGALRAVKQVMEMTRHVQDDESEPRRPAIYPAEDAEAETADAG